jgi:hypothetical protein
VSESINLVQSQKAVPWTRKVPLGLKASNRAFFGAADCLVRSAIGKTGFSWTEL